MVASDHADRIDRDQTEARRDLTPIINRQQLPQSVLDYAIQDRANERRGFVATFNPIGGSLIQSFDSSALTPGDAGLGMLSLTTIVAPTGSIPGSLTNDDANVYFGDSTGVYRAPRGGGTTATAMLIADASVTASGLTMAKAPDRDRLFYVSQQGELFGCLPADCVNTRKRYGSASGSRGVISDGQFVYWADPGTSAVAYQDGRILRCEVAGCVGPPKVFAKQQFRPDGITLSDADIYWSTQGNGGVDQGAIVRLAK